MGARLGRASDGRVVLREVPEGLASERAGLRPGDEILLVEGRDVRELSERQLHRALSGDEGSPLRLTVLRGEAVIRVTLHRTKPPKSSRAQQERDDTAR
ncbi:MAG: PDZ domain-containing protein [Polyangiaceae bacterium]